MSNLNKLVSLLAVAAVWSLLTFASAGAQNKNRSTGPRAAVTSFFSLLKTQQYAALYDLLPSQLRQQITREQLSLSLKRLESFIVIERMEISRVQERGDYAVVDTTIYGRLKKPLSLDHQEVNEGRVAAQQFLFRENGQWKIATADNRTQSFFLQRNPQFNRQFRLTPPKLEFKQDGEWRLMGRRQ